MEIYTSGLIIMRGMRQASNRAAKTAISFQCWVQESERGVSTSWVAFISTVKKYKQGDVAQMVERSLRMREARGSMPLFSKKKHSHRIESIYVYIYILYTRILFCVV